MVSVISIWYELFYLLLIICSHTVKCYKVLLFNTNNSSKHQSFVYKQLNDQIILFLKIQFSISFFFLRAVQISNSSIWPIDGTFQVLWLRVSVDHRAIVRASPYSSKFRHYRSLTIWFFSCHILDHSFRVLSPLQSCSGCILQPKPTGLYFCWIRGYKSVF